MAKCEVAVKFPPAGLKPRSTKMSDDSGAAEIFFSASGGAEIMTRTARLVEKEPDVPRTSSPSRTVASMGTGSADATATE